MIAYWVLRSPVKLLLLSILLNGCTLVSNGAATRSATAIESASPTPATSASQSPLNPTVMSSPVARMKEQDCRISFQTSDVRKSGWSKLAPVASPNGKLIAVSDNSDSGNAKMIVTGVDGSNRYVLDAPFKGEPLSSPVWSLDSQRLVFSNVFLSQPGGGDIYVMNADGSGLTKIASYVGYHDILAWSPDARQIAFTNGVVTGQGSGTRVIDYKIYVVNANGSGKPQAVAEGCQPIWQP